MTTQIKLKKSSVPSNAPGTGDLDYGELAINYADGRLYYKNSSNVIKNFIDSDLLNTAIDTKIAAIGSIDSATVLSIVLANSVDSVEVTNLIDSAYIQARQIVGGGGLDSAAVITLIDSAYVQLRQDYAYSSLTGTPSIPQSGVDFDPVGTDNSTDVTLAGSYDYLTLSGQQITLNQIDYSTDISNLPNILDSADIAAVAGEAGYYSSGDSAVFSTVTTTGNVVIGGNLQVNGTTVTVNATDLNVTDNMIYMNAGESNGSPVASIDVGWAANVNDNGSYAHVGMFRDATDDTFKVFHNYTPEPDAAVEINTGHASFALAPFAASTLSGVYLGFDSDFSGKSTTDLTEGTNLYYTSSRVDSDILSYGYTTCLGTVTSVASGTGLTGGPITGSGTLSLATAGAGAANYTGGISAVNVDAYGRVTSVSGSAGYTTCTGTVTSITVSAGTGLSGGGTVTTSGTATLNLDFAELTDMTADISGTTEFILQNGTVESRKAANEIKLSNFNNDAGWTSYDSADTVGLVDSAYVQARQDYAYSSLTGAPNVLDSANVSSIVTSYGYTTCVGTVTSATVSAGTGLSGGGTITSSGTVTLNLDFAELTDMTGDISGTTEFILQNGTTESRKAASEIKLSNFNNDAGWTSYDSADTFGLIDSAYVQLKAVGLDYNVLSNKPAVGGLDSAAVISLIDSDYVRLRQIGALIDSAVPTAVKVGDLWYDKTDGTLNIYYQDSSETPVFVNVAASTAAAAAGLDSAAALALFTEGTAIDITTGQISVDLSELTTSTSDGDGDYFVVVDTSNAQRKLTKGNINISGFNNNSGFTTCTGTVTSITVSAGTGLSGGGTVTTSGTATLNLDFSELTDMTGDISGTTEFILQNGTTESRKAASEIKLSNFNNDAGWTSYDSADTIGLVDSAYVQLRAVGLDYNVLSNKPAASGLDSAAVLSVTKINHPELTSVGLGGSALLNAGVAQSSNTAVGASSLTALTTGQFNSAFGRFALTNATTALRNTAVGYGSLRLNVIGSNNTAVGFCAGYSNTSADGVFIGYNAGRDITQAENVVIGRSALQCSTTATRNVAIGYKAGYGSGGKNIGNDNVLIGHAAGLDGCNFTGSVGIGRDALYGNKASYTTAVGWRSLYSNTTGSDNTAIGMSALCANTVGSGNTAVGYTALRVSTIGSYNTVLGAGSLSLNTTGSSNTAVGYDALSDNTYGTNNTGIGSYSLRNAVASNNTAVGYQSLYGNTTGTQNTAVGGSALRVNTAGVYNTAVGYISLCSNTTGNQNIAIGAWALCANTVGSSNTVIGQQGGSSLTTGSNNLVLGYNAQASSATVSNEITLGNGSITSLRIPGLQASASNGYVLTYDSDNANLTLAAASGGGGLDSAAVLSLTKLVHPDVTSVGLGASALANDDGSANNNTAVGQCALFNNTTGTCNTAVGNCSLYSNTTGCFNVAMGFCSLYGNIASIGNTAVGALSLDVNTISSYNTALGASSLTNNTTGSCNTAVGALSLIFNTIGGCNTAVGHNSLRCNTTGICNTAVGYGSHLSNTTGSCNTAVGRTSLYSNTSGSENAAFGVSALFSNSIGSCNTAVGRASLANSTTAFFNTAMGACSLYSNTTGACNTAIGFCAAATVTTESGVVAIGACAARGHNPSSNLTAFSSVAIGFEAMCNASTGSSNVAVGAQTLKNSVNTTANVAIGGLAGTNLTTGGGNVLVGTSAGCALTTGQLNTIVGYNAWGGAGLCNVTVIGYNAAASSATASNEITLGNANVTSLRIPGLQASASDGYVLTYDSDNGNLTLAAASGGGGGGVSAWVTKTANYTASNGDRIVADTTGGTFTITLPATPSSGDQVTIADGGDFSATNLTVGRNGSTIEGAAEDVTIDIKNVLVDFIYDSDATWQIYTQGILGQYGLSEDSSSIMYPTMVYHDSDTSGLKITSDKFSFNASSGTLNVTDLNSTSDATLKENISVIDNAVEKVKNISGVSFNWKDNKKAAIGVLAQEVEKILPELVDTNPRGEKSVKYNGIIGLLVEAIKEQQQTIDNLKQIIDRIK